MKTPIKRLKPSKLFYNKWPFKVECFIAGANRIVRNSPSAVETWCKTGKGLFLAQHEHSRIDKIDLFNFCTKVKQFLGRDDIRIRVEGSHFNLFCLDLTVLESIDNELNKWICEIYGPTTDEELEFMISNGHKKRLCDALPKSKYKYKIFFKTKFPEERRKDFVNWTENYGDKLDVSNTSERWLRGEKMWAQDPFMYVEDDKMLSMVGMYLSGYVKKVEHFVVRSEVLPA